MKTKVISATRHMLELQNELAKIHNLRSHIRFTLGDMCAKSNCPILVKDFNDACRIEVKKVRQYNEVPYEIWKQGKCIQRYEKGTWREFMHSTVNSQDLAAFIPRFAAKLVESPCPYGVGFENWTKLVWLCQTYNEIMENELTDPLTAKDFYASRVKKMYEVLEYSANTCW